MKIRKYRDADREEVKELVIKSLIEIFNNASNLEDLDNIKKDYEMFFVAEEKGKVIGTLGIKNEGDARISRMYVKTEKRGKGTGKKLMKEAMKYCKNRFTRIFLTTDRRMNSKEFYEKFGFKEYKRDKQIWMGLSLQNKI